MRVIAKAKVPQLVISKKMVNHFPGSLNGTTSPYPTVVIEMVVMNNESTKEAFSITI